MLSQLLLEATLETLYMVALASLLAILLGTPLGLLLFISDHGGLAQNGPLYRFLDLVVNVVRSIPYVIFMILCIPLTQLVLGRTIGPTATLVSLALSAAPFFARMLETSLQEVDGGVIEAAKAMGSTKTEIITRVLIPEAMPGTINAITMLVINLIGFTAMAGTLGAGGLGAIAVRYGYYRREETILYLSVVIIIILVQIVQVSGNRLARKVNKKK
ncbi:methionine ABC transporter permease [Kallipyga massiliensis]|uniref:methionine ABC transporter permease n=1 Tax=Kallipyga massiliensis TaxID=1472764 RepID=UPI0004B69101|nr:methionine ABC transporter permease [Kallipyga massiliensis]